MISYKAMMKTGALLLTSLLVISCDDPTETEPKNNIEKTAPEVTTSNRTNESNPFLTTQAEPAGTDLVATTPDESTSTDPVEMTPEDTSISEPAEIIAEDNNTADPMVTLEDSGTNELVATIPGNTNITGYALSTNGTATNITSAMTPEYNGTTEPVATIPDNTAPPAATTPDNTTIIEPPTAMPSSATVSLSSQNITTRVGDTFTLNLRMSNFSTSEGGGVTVTFNSSMLNVNNVTINTSVWDFVNQVGSINNNTGMVSDILFSSYGGVSSNNDIASIRFTAVGSGSSTIGLQGSSMNPFSSEGQITPANFVNTNVQINAQ
ncbi:MAG: hypothetical protein OEY06_03915 [Gammaproteobacteria bacterium]|nr:hypothetical protein [Gammaproteobacteria bacterium]